MTFIPYADPNLASLTIASSNPLMDSANDQLAAIMSKNGISPTVGTAASSGGNLDLSGYNDSVWNTSGTSGSGSSAPSYSPEDLAYIDNQMSLADQLLARINAQRSSGMTGIEEGYQSGVNKATDSRTRAQRDYNDTLERTGLAEQRAIGQVDDYARSLANSVRRRLGIAGAANSSAALYAAPNAIAKDASGKRTGVVENYANNYFDLKKADEDNAEDFTKYLGELENQKRAQLRDFEQGITEQQANVQNQKATLAGERARLLGGGYNGVRTAQQPYMDEYNRLSNSVTGLFDKYKAPVYQQRELTRANPTLRDYLVEKTAIKTDPAGNQDPYAPYSTLLKQDDEEQLV